VPALVGLPGIALIRYTQRHYGLETRRAPVVANTIR
jgi:hypothetical protein